MNQPSVAVIMLQPDCNMICPHCITEENFEIMSFDFCINLLDQFKKQEVQSIVFGGGEPTLWPHGLFSITEQAKKRGFHVQVGTNALELPQGFEFERSVDRWVLPLESMRAELHNQMRPCSTNHFEIIMDVLKRLQEAGRSVTISTLLTQINQNELDAISEFLIRYNQIKQNIHAWHIYQFLPLGRGGKKNKDQLILTETEFNQKFNSIKKKPYCFSVYRRLNMYQSKQVQFHSS